MENLIRKLLKEELNGYRESPEDFYHRFKEAQNGSTFLDDSFRNPDFEFRLTHEGGVRAHKYDCGMRNKCETNTFNFIRGRVINDDHRYYPVSGWAFMESTTFFEHFWVYDAVNDLFLDVTPMHDNQLPYAYGGVINKNINDEIKNADSYQDVKFLLGKVGSSLFHKFKDKPSNLKLGSFEDGTSNGDSKLFNYISKTPAYSDLNQFIKDYNISDTSELKNYLGKLKDLQLTVRSNREYDYFGKLIKQIQSLA